MIDTSRLKTGRLAWEQAFSPPTFLCQPNGGIVKLGSSVRMTVCVTGTPPPTLQWLKGADPIVGATNASFVLSPIALADAGRYSVLASNACGLRTSDPAIIEVQPSTAYQFAMPTLSGNNFRTVLTNANPGWPVIVETSTDLDAWRPFETNTAQLIEIALPPSGSLFLRSKAELR